MDVELHFHVLSIDTRFAVKRAVQQAPVKMRVRNRWYILFSELEILIFFDVRECASTRLCGFNHCRVTLILQIYTRKSCLYLFSYFCHLGLLIVVLHNALVFVRRLVCEWPLFARASHTQLPQVNNLFFCQRQRSVSVTVCTLSAQRSFLNSAAKVLLFGHKKGDMCRLLVAFLSPRVFFVFFYFFLVPQNVPSIILCIYIPSELVRKMIA